MTTLQERFTEKFVTKGMFGEDRLVRIFSHNLSKSDPIPLDEQVVAELLSFLSQEVERAKIETMQDLMKEWLYRRGMYEKFEDGKVPLVIVDNLLGGLSDNNK